MLSDEKTPSEEIVLHIQTKATIEELRAAHPILFWGKYTKADDERLLKDSMYERLFGFIIERDEKNLMQELQQQQEEEEEEEEEEDDDDEQAQNDSESEEGDAYGVGDDKNDKKIKKQVGGIGLLPQLPDLERAPAGTFMATAHLCIPRNTLERLVFEKTGRDFSLCMNPKAARWKLALMIDEQTLRKEIDKYNTKK